MRLPRALAALSLLLVAAPAAGQVTAIVLDFRERAPDEAEARPLRAMVTPTHLRFDDGGDGGDFILFDRRSGTIYSVTAADRTILVIRRRAVPGPEVLRRPGIDEERLRDEGAPTVAGRVPQRLRLRADGMLCREAVVVPGLLEEARRAFAEFKVALAGEQAASYDKIPPEFRDPCDLALHVVAADRHLAAGFPIRERDYTGRVRELVDYREGVPVDAALFELPEGWRRLSMDVLR